MANSFSKLTSWLISLITAVAGVFMGWLLKFLMMIKDSECLDAINMSAETAVRIMQGLSLSVLIVSVQAIYLVLKNCKLEKQILLIKDRATVQKQEIEDAIIKMQYEYAEAEKTHIARTRFMTRMSHELRTPMNAILGYAMLIERFSDNPEKVTRYARRIFVSGQMLLEMINDALDIRCIEKGNIKLIENEFSLMTTLDEVVTAVKPLLEAKNQSFKVYVSNAPDIDWITGDKQKLSQIFRNILSNASKYTPEKGKVEMIADITKQGTQDLNMIWQVNDNGCGMTGEFLENVFKPFEREENDMNTSVPGTGLGLCIARSFTELMGGNLSICSEPGRGTRVTIAVPLKISGNHEKSITDGLCEGTALSGLKFLAAEDNKSNAEIICEVLIEMGASCTVAQHGQAAVELFEKSLPGQFDIILMDVQMPVMNGYQAASAIRQSSHPDAEKIKIIAMTADAFDEDVQQAFASGMDAHVAKPFNIEALINTVAAL